MASHSANETAATQDPKVASCCAAAPPVLQFDTEGNLISSWGGPGEGYDWPSSNHGITIDHKGIVWIGGNGQGDGHVLKFTQDGAFVAQYGKPGQPIDSNNTTYFGRVAKIFVDPEMNDERRIYYELTGAGRAALEAELMRYRGVVAVAEGRLAHGH